MGGRSGRLAAPSGRGTEVCRSERDTKIPFFFEKKHKQLGKEKRNGWGVKQLEEGVCGIHERREATLSMNHRQLLLP